MRDTGAVLARMRDRMVVGAALVKRLTDLSLLAPSGIDEEISALVAAASQLVEDNISDINELMVADSSHSNAA